jgi:hypothetical protein
MYGNSTIGNVGSGDFTNASPSVPIVSASAPSSFTMSKIAVTSTQAPHPATVQTAAAVTTPPVAQKIAAPQAVVSAPPHEAPGEHLICLDLHTLTSSAAAPAPVPATSATAPATQYNEWTANILVEVSVPSI